MKRLALLIILSGIMCFANAQQVTATLSKNKILIGQQVYLKLEVAQASPSSIIWPRLKDTINEFIEILDSVISGDDTKGWTKNYLVTSFDSGSYLIQPFKFYIDSQLIETNSLLLEVNTVPVDTSEAFRDIKGIRAESYSFMEKVKDFFQWLLEHWYIPLALVVLIVGLIIYIRKKRKKAKPAVVPEIIFPLHEQLLRDLEILDKKQLWQNNQVKQYYTELTDLLRSYIEKRFGVKAHEQTTFQLIKNLKSSGLSTEGLEIIRNILEGADMVKFAKSVPTQYENEGIMNNARRFALLTKKEEEVSHD